jgi:hypothetical protein
LFDVLVEDVFADVEESLPKQIVEEEEELYSDFEEN